MYCTQCGRELRPEDHFCSSCGRQLSGTVIEVEPKRLMLDKRRKKIAGVCAGFARYFDMDLVLMRVLWLAIALCTGVGFLAYVAAWIVIPSDWGRETSDVIVTAQQPS